ncbi:MAG TPA: hypothetical protein VFA07_15575 [Chthonomonadaceae bacterium]|nr:hypothetical protein [Chthonomonadaceae bacterium]
MELSNAPLTTSRICRIQVVSVSLSGSRREIGGSETMIRLKRAYDPPDRAAVVLKEFLERNFDA